MPNPTRAAAYDLDMRGVVQSFVERLIDSVAVHARDVERMGNVAPATTPADYGGGHPARTTPVLNNAAVQRRSSFTPAARLFPRSTAPVASA